MLHSSRNSARTRRRAERQKTSAVRRASLSLGGPAVGQGLRPGDRGGHGEGLVRDVHQAEEERLLVLQLRLVDEHAVEARAGEPPRRALHEAQVGGQRAELGVPRPERPAQPPGGVPPGVEGQDAGDGPELGRERLAGVHQGSRHLQVLVHHLAGHEQVHDLGRALEDLVDAVVAHHALDRDRVVAPRGEGLLGLVPAPAADLHRLVHDLPGPVGDPLLRRRRLEADVVAAAVGHLGGEAGHRLHGEGAGGDVGDLVGDRLVLADRLAPLHALVRPAAHDARGTPSPCRPRCSGWRGGRR